MRECMGGLTHKQFNRIAFVDDSMPFAHVQFSFDT